MYGKTESPVAGVPLTFEKIFTPLYRDVDIYARAMTIDGVRLLETLGFTRGAQLDGVSNPALHVFPRKPAPATSLPSIGARMRWYISDAS